MTQSAMPSDDSQLVRTVVFYSGTVQGVGFRATTKRVATNHAVTGWVRNEDDGRVQLCAQGTRAAVGAFLDAVSETLAQRIESVVRTDALVDCDETAFVIQRKLWTQRWP